MQYTAGRLLLRSDQPERALLYLGRALRLNGEPIEYHLSLAEAQARTGHPDQSIATLQAILAKHPDETRAQHWLAEMRARAAGSAQPTPVPSGVK